MFRFNRFLVLNALALLAFALPALAQDTPPDPVPTDCSGCTFWLNGPNYGNNGAANPCGTDVRVTIMGFSGACKLDDGDCVQESPCFAGVQVEYRSSCPLTARWEYGPLGTPPIVVPIPPTPGGGWVSLGPILETLPCGSPMMILLLDLTDTAGYSKFASAQFGCTECN